MDLWISENLLKDTFHAHQATESLQDFICRAIEGIETGGARIYAKNVRFCSLNGVRSMDIYIQMNSQEGHLLCMAAFMGRKPHYRPWLELFSISSYLQVDGKNYFYYDSAIEDDLLKVISEAIQPGGKVYIEYYQDRETACGLAMEFPAAITRQGFKLLKLGFTWFKDWYFSEGGHEGGQKLQGEKPLNERSRKRQMQKIRAEVDSFLKHEELKERIFESDCEVQYFVLRAKERGKEILASDELSKSA